MKSAAAFSLCDQITIRANDPLLRTWIDGAKTLGYYYKFNTNIMKSKTQFFIGIDVSKPFFDASLMAVVNHEKNAIISEQFGNTNEGMKVFAKWLKSHKVTMDKKSILVIENTGVYHRLLWAFCNKIGLPIHIGNAAHIKWSFGIARGKNDQIDSVRLCQYAYKEGDSLKETSLFDPVLLQLKDLFTARSSLLTKVNSIKVYIKELKGSNDKGVQKIMERAHKSAIDGLQKSIIEIENQIKKIIAQSEAIKVNYDLLLTVPGVGPLTAIYMICCTANFSMKITGKQFACYAGVVPFEHSSGISIKGRNRVHRMANKDLKKMLHLGALTAIRVYPEFQIYYQRKKEEGKHGMSVLNAIRNKIILRAVAVINNQRPYEVDRNTVA